MIIFTIFPDFDKGHTEQEKLEFLKEAQLMGNFKHAHILQLLGVCLDKDPNFIIMELMEGGDLLSYLRASRPLIVSKVLLHIYRQHLLVLIRYNENKSLMFL